MVLQREKDIKSKRAQHEVLGHYRENDSSKKVSAVNSKSEWIRKERLTGQYRIRVHAFPRLYDLPQAVKNGIEHFPVIMQEPQAVGKITTPGRCERWLC